MTTGADKTYTDCTFVADAKRILFLVDRKNLGDQTHIEFQQYRPPDDGRHFTDLYVTQHLKSRHIDKDASVVITTIQRVYSPSTGKVRYCFSDLSLSSVGESDSTTGSRPESWTARNRAEWKPGSRTVLT